MCIFHCYKQGQTIGLFSTKFILMSRIPSIPQSLKAWEDGLEEIDIGNQAFVVEEDHLFIIVFNHQWWTP